VRIHHIIHPSYRYIGTEFFFYIVSPVFLLSLRRSPVFGLTLTAAACLISSLWNAATMLQYNFPPTQMLWIQPEIFSPDYIKVP
jgi:peptidoglycan/LPS O-acetylase OafA/YrhL